MGTRKGIKGLVCLGVCGVTKVKAPGTPMGGCGAMSGGGVCNGRNSSVSMKLVMRNSCGLVTGGALCGSSVDASFNKMGPCGGACVKGAVASKSDVAARMNSVMCGGGMAKTLALKGRGVTCGGAIKGTVDMGSGSVTCRGAIDRLGIATGGDVIGGGRVGNTMGVTGTTAGAAFTGGAMGKAMAMLSGGGTVTKGVVRAANSCTVSLGADRGGAVGGGVLVTGSGAKGGTMGKGVSGGVTRKGTSGGTVVALVAPRAITTNRTFAVGIATASSFKGPLGNVVVVRLGSKGKMLYGIAGNRKAVGYTPDTTNAAVAFAGARLARVRKFSGVRFVSDPMGISGCGAGVITRNAAMAVNRGTAVDVLAAGRKLGASLPIIVDVGNVGVAMAAGKLARMMVGTTGLVIKRGGMAVCCGKGGSRGTDGAAMAVVMGGIGAALATGSLIVACGAGPS